MTKRETIVVGQPRNPFPMTLKDGRVVIDELCRCGAFRSAHDATFGVAFGRGPCDASGCAKYTFKDFVFRAAKHPRARKGA